MHHRDVRRTVEEEPRLLPDLAQLDVDRDGVWDTGVDGGLVCVEQGLQERVRRSGLRREHEPPLRSTRAACPPDGRAHAVEGGRSVTEEHLTRRGQAHATSIAVEELHADPRLELPDRTRQRRLRHPESERCSSEVSLLRHGQEVPELAGLDVVHVQSVRPVIPVGYHR